MRINNFRAHDRFAVDPLFSQRMHNALEYRCRVYQDGDAHLLDVRDLIQSPFIAPDFPRGKLVFESVGVCEGVVIFELAEWLAKKKYEITSNSYEIVVSPARIFRCRLYGIPITEGGIRKNCDYVEVWDTLQVPFEEYNTALPNGDLIEAEEDFSRHALRHQMRRHWVRHSIAGATTWSKDSHWGA